MADFAVTSSREAGSLVVAPTGELDIATVDAVRAEVEQRRGDEGLEIDLSGVDFLDTSGIQLIVESHRAARAEGFELSVHRAPPGVQRVFKIAGLEGVLPFVDGDGRA